MLICLAVQIGPGNRVDPSVQQIAAATHTSPRTVRRALTRLRSANVLLAPDDGLPMVNPVYFAHDPTENDYLRERFGVSLAAHNRDPLAAK